VADDVRDEEAVALLKRAAARTGGSGAAGGAADTATSVAPDPPAFEREITWTAGDLELAGHLAIPDRATGAVILAHGSGARSPGIERLLQDAFTMPSILARA
jgi:putative phosphoribosyl transferase